MDLIESLIFGAGVLAWAVFILGALAWLAGILDIEFGEDGE